MNIFTFFYRKAVRFCTRLHVYGERTGKYLGLFKKYVNNVKIVLDVGCGSGSFSKALSVRRRLVIALDVDKEALRRIRSSRIEKVCADVVPSFSDRAHD